MVTIQAVVTTPDGCQDTETIELTLYPALTATVSGNTTACLDGSQTFQVTLSGGNGSYDATDLDVNLVMPTSGNGAASQVFSAFSATGDASVFDITFTPTPADVEGQQYTFTVDAEDGVGCTATSAPTTITLDGPNDATVMLGTGGSATVCSNENISGEITVSNASGTYQVVLNVTEDGTPIADVTITGVTSGTPFIIPGYDNATGADVDYTFTIESITEEGGNACSVRDANESGSFTVTVEPNPELSAIPTSQNVGTSAGGTGDCLASVTFTAPTITGGCAPVTGTISYSPALASGQTTFTSGESITQDFPIGITTLTFTVADGNSNMDSDNSFVVTVADDEDPVAVCAATAPVVMLDASGTGTLAADALGDGSSTDNCSATETSPLTTFTCADAIGTPMVQLTATDPSGNTNTIMCAVDVQDNMDPVAVCAATAPVVMLDASGTGTLAADALGDGSSTDNCPATETSPLTTFTCADAIGTPMVQLTATDPSGNTNTIMCAVDVQDNMDPVAVCAATAPVVMLDASGTGTLAADALGDGSSTDNCSATETSPLTTFTCADAIGTPMVQLTATDPSGNTNTIMCAVDVQDNMDPVAVCAATAPVVMLDASGTGTLAADALGDGSSTDNCSATETSPLTTFTCADAIGTPMVQLTATDPSGNTNTIMCAVDVQDNMDPVAVCAATAPVVMLDASGTGTLAADALGDGSSTDNCSATETSPLTTFTCADAIGTPMVQLTATDPSGNTNTIMCAVDVQDNMDPVAVCAATAPVVMLDASGTGTLAADALGDGSSTDNCSATETSPLTTFTCADAIGTPMVQLTATDPSGNTNTIMCAVDVQDNMDPVAVCAATAPVVMLDASGTGTLAADALGDGSSTDNCSATETSPLTTFTCADAIGTPMVQLTATDPSGNTNTIMCAVDVQDNMDPVAVCAATAPVVMLDASGTGTLAADALGDGSSTDNCSATETSPLTTFTCADAIGTPMVQLTATDPSGNTNTIMCAVDVQDNIGPRRGMRGYGPGSDAGCQRHGHAGCRCSG